MSWLDRNQAQVVLIRPADHLGGHVDRVVLPRVAHDRLPQQGHLVLGLGVGGHPAVVEQAHRDHARTPDRGQRAVGVGHRRGERLLHQDVDARLGRRHHHIGVQVVGGGDRHRVDRARGQQLLVVGVDGGSHPPGQFLRVLPGTAGHGGDLGVRMGRQHLGMPATHDPGTYDADSQLRQERHSNSSLLCRARPSRSSVPGTRRGSPPPGTRRARCPWPCPSGCTPASAVP